MDCSLPVSSVHKIFPGKNTGAGYHVLLQGIFPSQWQNLHLLHWQANSLPLSPKEMQFLFYLTVITSFHLYFTKSSKVHAAPITHSLEIFAANFPVHHLQVLFYKTAEPNSAIFCHSIIRCPFFHFSIIHSYFSYEISWTASSHLIFQSAVCLWWYRYSLSWYRLYDITEFLLNSH